MTNTRYVPKTVGVLFLGLAALAAPGVASADGQLAAVHADIEKTVGFVPSFVKAMPDNLVPGIWEEVRGFELNPRTALPPRTKDLIGLAIAAQMPSRLTAWSYGKCAKAWGATEAQLKEAVAISALARHWSTFFNGMQLDEGKFRAEIAKLRENISKGMASGSPPPAPLAISNADSVLNDAQQSFGFVPEFLRHFPPEALPGAWLSFRNVEMNPHTALSGKDKSLIGLAVAAQIPCRYCIISDTEFARLQGASEREIAEAVTAGSMARQYITLVEGLQLDEKSYRRDWERLTSSPAPRADRAAAAPASRMAARAE
ncbi:MAG TPA: carboxymuconolactone decarboxylase family protein [Polyangia bacterium]|nr:carboxymuconolactone decarboxylase family protein [Polyangia bacterium]